LKIEELLEAQSSCLDAGVHGALEWTCRQWHRQENGKTSKPEGSKTNPQSGLGRSRFPAGGPRPRWFANNQGQTFTTIGGPVKFLAGSPSDDPARHPDEIRRSRTVPRSFSLAMKEVTREEYRAFLLSRSGRSELDADLARYSPDPRGPMVMVSWYDAVAYCNWLSQRESIPEDQWCYLPVSGTEYREGMTIPPEALSRTGYRLPTEDEWEYACRAGALTSRYFGDSMEFLPNYARFRGNAGGHAWRCGESLPNDLGLFDMLGNAREWCHDAYDPKPTDSTVDARSEQSRADTVSDTNPRVIRGGSFDDLSTDLRCAKRWYSLPASRYRLNGFRVARTIPVSAIARGED
jgi:formylglycine-generating enzyme required for sulfatase activity